MTVFSSKAFLRACVRVCVCVPVCLCVCVCVSCPVFLGTGPSPLTHPRRNTISVVAVATSSPQLEVLDR